MAKRNTRSNKQGSPVLWILLIIVITIYVVTVSCSNRRQPVLTLLVGGDCLLDRYNGKTGVNSWEDHRWDTLAKAARNSNAFLFNLETTIGQGGSPKNKQFVFRAPIEALYPLSQFKSPVVALANNHSMDYGPAGLLASIAALDEAHIVHTGAGNTMEAAWKEARINCPGGTLSVLSCGFDDDETSFTESFGAVIAPINVEMLKDKIHTCKATSLAVVVMLHWGFEYETTYTYSQQHLARSLIDAGADLVVGSGPHVLQGLEEYHGSLICYSIGNLIFDDLGSDETSAAVIIRMTFFSSVEGSMQKEFEVAPLRTTQISIGPTSPLLQDAKDVIKNIVMRSPFPSVLYENRYFKQSNLYWFSIKGQDFNI